MKAVLRPGAGFYGKVRTHGDFVGHGLPPAFVERWDAWVQRGLLAARQRDGDGWLERYLAMPVWRFSAHAAILDERACAGVFMPGIDAVGRYFPFVIAQQTEGRGSAADSPWYEEASALALSTLAPSFSLAAFRSALVELQAQPAGFPACDGASAWWTRANGAVHRHDGPLDADLFLYLLDGD
jgi:type VI secretion system protein ImpM